MPYSGSGLFSRVYNWVADRNANVKIRADRMDTEMGGFAAGLSNAICRDGQSTITASIPFNGQKITGLGDATAATDAMNRQTSDSRYKWIAVADQTLAANATQFTDIVLGTYSKFRINITIVPNPAAADFFTIWRGSGDGATFPSGGSDYTYEFTQGLGAATVSSTGNTTGGFVTGTLDTGNASFVGEAELTFWKGSASTRPTMRGCCITFSSNFDLITSGSYMNTSSALTHLRILASAANGLGIGSRIIVEGC